MTTRAVGWLWEHARRHPEKIAMETGDSVTTYAQLALAAAHASASLAAHNVSRGDRVATFMDLSGRFVEVLHAAQAAGVVLVPLATDTPVPELLDRLDRVGPELLLYDSALKARLRPVFDARPKLRAVNVEGELRHLEARPVPGHAEPDAPDPDDVSTILFTAGATGESKAVELTYRNHLASAAASRANLKAQANDAWLPLLHPSHVAGLAVLLRAALDGARLVIPSQLEPGDVNDLIHARRVTMLSVGGTLLARMIEAADRPYPPSVRAALVGGGALPTSLGQAASRLRLPVAATYGLTEAASQVCTTKPGRLVDHPDSCGRPLEGIEVRVETRRGRDYGDVWVRGANVMRGYFEQPEATSAALADGWLSTGDLGRLDEDGYLYLAGRRVDAFLSADHEVYPVFVERELVAHPDVLEAAVYPFTDPDFGPRPAAVVVLRADSRMTANGMRSWVRRRLAAYQAPAVIRIVDRLPRTRSGKLRRFELAEV